MANRRFDAGLPSDVAAALLDAVYATVPAGLCFLDSELRYVRINQHLAAIHGRPIEAHIGRRMPDVIGDFGRLLEPIYRTVLQSGVPTTDLEISGDGRGPPWEGRIWRLDCFPFFHGSGPPLGVNGVVTEITSQRKAEIAQRAAEAAANRAVERLNFALEKAEAAEWEVNYREKTARWSPQMYPLYGLPTDIRPSTDIFLSILPAEDRVAWQAAKQRAFAEHRQEFRQDFRVFHPAKGLRWISSRAYIQYTENGLPERIGGIKIDITELKNVQADLEEAKEIAEQANEAKSRFLAAASHDLRQPLQALCLYHSVLAGRASTGDQPVLEHMENCLSSLNELLSDLLDLSKLDAGVVAANTSDFDIGAQLAKIASARLPEAERKGLVLRVVPTRLVGRTDALLFERVVGNLVTNAVRYTHAGGIVVGCRRRRGKVWVEVWDTGIGIPANQTGAIFEPFHQLGNPERSREKGSGLGLAIVRKTAELLGIGIRVRSSLGKGSMFAVELPLGKKPAAPAPPPLPPPKDALRIALVEDDCSVREATTYALEQMGHQVVAGASATELVGHLRQRPPDVMIADYRLIGDETGLDAIAAVRSSFTEPFPAVILTGNTDPETVRSLLLGKIRVLHKPLSLEALRSCVSELARRKDNEAE